MKIQQAKERFSALLKIQFLAESSKNNYEKAVFRFLDHCSWAEDTDEIELSHIQDYIIFLNDYYATSTVGVAVSAIRTFCESVLSRKYSKREIPKPKTKREPAVFYEEDQMKILIDSCRDVRLKAWILLAFDCGMRVSEVAHLRWTDIDKETQTIRIMNSKRDKCRLIQYSPVTRDALNRYWSVYSPYCKRSIYIFPGKKEDASISPSTISSHFKKYARNFPFHTEKHHFHSLRHSFCTAMAARISNPYVLAELMGHSSIQTTMKYVHMSPDRFKNYSSPCSDWN